jgi:opacity protein-like surface antigen
MLYYVVFYFNYKEVFMFKKYLFAITIAASTTAFAGGGMVPPKNVLTLPDGAYAGLGIGIDSYKINSTVSITGTGSPAINSSDNAGQMAFLGQLFAGYNRNFGQYFNLGAELFIAYNNSSVTIAQSSVAAFQSSFKNRFDYGVELMPAWNIASNARIFGGIGAAFGSFKYNPPSIAIDAGSPASYTKDALPGLLLSAGADIAVTDKISLRGEYQFIDYENWAINTPLTSGPFETSASKLKEKSSQFLASIAYHFS